LLAVVLAACAPLAAAGDDESKLIEVLTSNAPPPEKAITCKKLVLCGTKAAVPALAALLPNPELASWARIGLEAIPDPAVDDAFRAAMDKTQGRLLVGVINSIGFRRDAKATDGLIQKLKDADAEVASAAAAALGRIGGPAATKALEQSLASTPPPVRTVVAEGCILCAERSLAEGNAGEATRIYDLVRNADVPKQRKLEGIRGAVLARGDAGIPLMFEQLKSTDKEFLGIGLRVARELPGSAATEALVAEVARLAPERQALLILALGDRNDPKALPALLEAIKSGSKAASLAAISMLDRIGDATCVPVLVKVAVEGDDELSLTAKGALAKLPNQGVDADIVDRLSKTTGKARQVLVETAGLRRIEASLPALVQCAEDADPGVRAAAIAGIGALGGEQQVPGLVKLLQKASTDERASVEKALMGTSSRAGAACVPQLLPLAQHADTAIRMIGLHTLAAAGGPEALNALKAALNDKDEGVQDEAARTLSTWPNKFPDDTAAAEPLLTLAKSGKKQNHQILALRGYLQYLQGTKLLKDDEKLAKFKDVQSLVTRPEEKRLAISVLGANATAGALEVLLAYTGEAGVTEEACQGIVNLVGRPEMGKAPKELRQKALQTVVEKGKNGRMKKQAADMLKGIK
jgi:HEAT repeat protein